MIEQGDPTPAMPDMTTMLRGAKATATLQANIAIGGTFNVPIVWPYELPNTDYSVVPAIEGATGLVGALVCQMLAGSKTTTGCTVVVKNTGLLALGLNAVVTALAVYV